MKSVTYWYQFFTRGEELVPIIHDVKFTKCEIYGSTKLVVLVCIYLSCTIALPYHEHDSIVPY